jgi:hypothetical protein
VKNLCAQKETYSTADFQMGFFKGFKNPSAHVGRLNYFAKRGGGG